MIHSQGMFRTLTVICSPADIDIIMMADPMHLDAQPQKNAGCVIGVPSTAQYQDGMMSGKHSLANVNQPWTRWGIHVHVSPVRLVWGIIHQIASNICQSRLLFAKSTAGLFL